jgi:hypothetical protein
MRYPSIKTLLQIVDSPEDAKILRTILTSTSRDQLTGLSTHAAEYNRQCFNYPALHLLKLYAANQLLGSHGVEGSEFKPGVYIEYLNQGDPYIPTLLRFNNRGRISYRVTDWGSIAEKY